MLDENRLFKRYSDRILISIAVIGFLSSIFSWTVTKFWIKPQNLEIHLTGIEAVTATHAGELKDHERRLTTLEIRFQDSQDRIADGFANINASIRNSRSK